MDLLLMSANLIRRRADQKSAAARQYEEVGGGVKQM